MDQIPAIPFSLEPETLMALSRLFTYPEQLPRDRDLARVSAQAGPVPACPSLTVLQNRYVSLFILHPLRVLVPGGHPHGALHHQAGRPVPGVRV